MSISASGSRGDFVGFGGISLIDSLGLGDEEGFPLNLIAADGSAKGVEAFEEQLDRSKSAKRIETIRFIVLP